MFVAREKELGILEERYSNNKLEMLVLYGRRRVGKTALLREFIKNKDAIFFTAIQNNGEQNLENLSSSISLYTGFPCSFKTFQDAFDYTFKLSLEKRIVFVLDEYQYLTKSDSSLSSVLQLLLDR